MIIGRRTAGICALALAGVLSLAGCGGGDDGGASSSTPRASTPPASRGGESDVASAFPQGEPVDFVLLADSGGGGVAELYAAKAEESLDREVRIWDYSRGGATADDILYLVQHVVTDQVADAEIVVFYVQPGPGYEVPGFAPCLQAVNWDSPVPPASFPPTLARPEPTTVEDWQGYRDTLDRIYGEIWKLRDGQPTILRAYGVWLPWLDQWRQLGIESECVATEESVEQARRGAAEAHGAVFVSAMDLFWGTDRDKDPFAQGLMSEDGMHLSEDGAAMLVDALAAAGFEPSEPPN